MKEIISNRKFDHSSPLGYETSKQNKQAKQTNKNYFPTFKKALMDR